MSSVSTTNISGTDNDFDRPSGTGSFSIATQALRTWLLSCCPSGTKYIHPTRPLLKLALMGLRPRAILKRSFAAENATELIAMFLPDQAILNPDPCLSDRRSRVNRVAHTSLMLTRKGSRRTEKRFQSSIGFQPVEIHAGCVCYLAGGPSGGGRTTSPLYARRCTSD